MVDKIPWDTCVIALIFGAFKTELKRRALLPVSKCVASHPSPRNTMLKLWRNSMYTCPTLYGGGGVGGGAEEV